MIRTPLRSGISTESHHRGPSPAFLQMKGTPATGIHSGPAIKINGLIGQQIAPHRRYPMCVCSEWGEVDTGPSGLNLLPTLRRLP